METRVGLGGSPAMNIFSSDPAVMRIPVDDRIRHLRADACGERVAGAREGLRQHVGHALMTLGRAIHGLEPEQPARPALDAW
jgi:hypothetical protein